jgi:hypothetical protein
MRVNIMQNRHENYLKNLLEMHFDHLELCGDFVGNCATMWNVLLIKSWSGKFQQLPESVLFDQIIGLVTNLSVVPS